MGVLVVLLLLVFVLLLYDKERLGDSRSYVNSCVTACFIFLGEGGEMMIREVETLIHTSSTERNTSGHHGLMTLIMFFIDVSNRTRK